MGIKQAADQGENVTTEPELKMHPLIVTQKYKMASDRLRLDRLQQSECWDSMLQKAASTVVHGIRSDQYLEFEKNAAAHLNDNGYGVELYALAKFVGTADSNFVEPNSINTKIAEISNNHVVTKLSPAEQRILVFVKSAHVARKQFEAIKQGEAWIESELKKIG